MLSKQWEYNYREICCTILAQHGAEFHLWAFRLRFLANEVELEQVFLQVRHFSPYQYHSTKATQISVIYHRRTLPDEGVIE